MEDLDARFPHLAPDRRARSPSLPVYGQTANTGAIAGSVSDPSGASVATAALVVKSQATQEERDLTTDAEGYFSVRFGNHNLTVNAPGFEPFVLKSVQVKITEVSRLKIRLTISGAKEQITVSAAPLFFKRKTPLSDESSIETRLKNCRWSIATLPRSSA